MRTLKYKIRAAREAATSRQGLERLASETQSMLKTGLFDLEACRMEVNRIVKVCAQFASENMHPKNIMK